MFWQGFPMIFPKNAILEKIAFSLKKTSKIKGSSHEKIMKINANLASKKQHRKQRENIGSRTLHGSILESLGRLLGAIGALLGAMIAFLGRSLALLGRLFGLMGASGLIWEGFGRLLGGSWEVLGSMPRSG